MSITKEVITKAAVTGAVGAVGSYLLFKESSMSSINFFNLLSLPIPVVIGLDSWWRIICCRYCT